MSFPSFPTTVVYLMVQEHEILSCLFSNFHSNTAQISAALKSLHRLDMNSLSFNFNISFYL